MLYVICPYIIQIVFKQIDYISLYGNQKFLNWLSHLGDLIRQHVSLFSGSI